MKKNLIYTGMIALMLTAGSITKTNAQWSLTGNSTTAPNNVLGTTNATDLNIKTNNITRLFIKGSNGQVGIGTATPAYTLDIQNATGNASMFFKSGAGNANILIERFSSANSASVNYRTNGTASWQTGNIGNDNFVINNVGLATPSVTVLKTSNNVGISKSTPTSRLDVLGGAAAGDTNAVVKGVTSFAGAVDVVGVQGTSTASAGYGIGVQGDGNFLGMFANGGANGMISAAAGFTDTTTATGNVSDGVDGYGGDANLSIGGYFQATTGQFNTGVYAVCGPTGTPSDSDNTHHRWAGYFVGDIIYSRAFRFSDKKLKTDIQPLSDIMSKLYQIQTSNYTFKRSEYPGLDLPSGKQIGFIAENVEKVFPELVKDASMPAIKGNKYGKIAREAVSFKAVNYEGFIPLTVAAIKEQQAQIDAKDAQIADLSSKLSSLESRLAALEAAQAGEKISSTISGARLEQNSPNPFSQSTVIRYAIPANSSAQIVINGSNGSTLKTYSVKSSGQIMINANELTTGSYTYSLLVDGKVIDTKTLVLTK